MEEGEVRCRLLLFFFQWLELFIEFHLHVSSYAWSWNRCKSWCRGTRRTRCHRGTAWRRPCSRNGRGWLPRRVREVDEQLLYMRSTSQWSQTVDQSTAGFVFRSLDDLEYSSSTCCRVHGPRFQSVSTTRTTFISPPSRPPLPIISSFISSAPITRWEIVFRPNIWG